MKKFYLCLCLIILSVIIVAPALALPEAIFKGRGIHANNGGVFKFDVSGVLGLSDGYHYTWCLEKYEYISGVTDTKYYAELSTSAMNGGVGGSPDPLDARTAYLYQKYRNAGPGADGSNSYVSNNAEAALFQNAVWALEQEIAAPSMGNNKYYDEALVSGAASIGNVRVMRLWASYDAATGEYSGRRQDQLVSVPDASIMYLLGTGLLGLGILGRKKNRS